jgi:hypothetical protein
MDEIGTLPALLEPLADVYWRARAPDTGPTGLHWMQMSTSRENGMNQLRKRTPGL